MCIPQLFSRSGGHFPNGGQKRQKKDFFPPDLLEDKITYLNDSLNKNRLPYGDVHATLVYSIRRPFSKWRLKNPKKYKLVSKNQ